jgi:hypothetical protein
LTAVLVVTTGIAAAPVRHALAPLFAQPLSQWLGHAPAVASNVQLATQSASAATTRDVDLDTPLVAAPDRLSYSVASHGKAGAEETNKSDSESQRPAWVDYAGSRRSNNSNVGSSRSSASFEHGAFGGRLGSMSRSDARSGGDSESARPSNGTSSASGSGKSGGPKNGDPGDAKKDEKNKGPDDLFGGHKSGLPELKGDKKVKNSPLPGKGVGGSNVAVNPEPSTLFLFGTGIVAAAGAIRRRLK